MWDKVASFVAEKVFEAGKLLKGVHEEVEKINEKLESIQVIINREDRMVAADEQGNTEMKIKVKHLREAALRIEEVNEDYMITQQHQPPRDPGCATILYAMANFIKTMFHRLKISYEIQDIKSSIPEINDRSGLQIQSSYEKGSSSGSQPQHALRRDALYVEEADVVGFEAPKNELIGWLKETPADRTVICVVGMGGQGKTTLVKTVYDKVIGDFDCHAWITVSQVYTVEGLLRTMLKEFGKDRKEDSEANLESLTKEVRKYLQQKRYVVFFDDVWNKDFWSEIGPVVLDSKNGSRIVITTRSMDVATFCKRSAAVRILELQPLSKQQSWELFCKKAFKNATNGICPTGLEDISSEIVKKCDGLPLAIVAVGGLIVTTKEEETLHEMQKLSRAMNYELDRNPDSFGITNILGLSYDVLPYYLKSCFLYFGIYPEDYKVRSKRLIRQWIAEGFVKSDERHEALEEVAEQYLKELIQRSLVQASSFSIDGKPKTCRVHDLLRDMILTKIKDLGFCHFGCDELSMISGKIRRLQIVTNSNHDYLKFTNIEGSLIRSLHFLGYEELPGDFMSIIPAKCKQLKVLEISSVDYIPKNLGNLIHLRYLRFGCFFKVESLLESIGNLQNLDTLDLGSIPNVKLTREINKLRKLRHLLLDSVGMMEGVRGLESLQTLDCVDIEFWGEEELKELEELKQLRSLALLEVEPKYANTLFCSINKMEHLEKLHIRATGSIDWDRLSPRPTLNKLSLLGKLERFPEGISKHKNLVKLSLYDSHLIDDPMKSLVDLPNLLSLCLWNAYEGETFHFENGERFINLRN